VKLAVLGALGERDAGSDVCLELIETESDDLANFSDYFFTFYFSSWLTCRSGDKSVVTLP
jgi:hypothetical protein